MTAIDVEAVLAQLTLAEKAALLSGSSFWRTEPIDRLGVPSIMVSDGPHGLRVQPDEADHVGLGGSIPATCFPTASAIASTWDPALLRRVGEALGQEARASRLSVILGPGINMKRSPLCGRNFEYFSEDPLLAGELAVGIVDGIQARGIGTSVKHFAANNQETDRLRVDTQVDERTLREIYLPAFERVVEASEPWTVMCSYNKINGTSASQNSWLLTQILRDEFGFDGLVVSDWGAVYDRVAAATAGLDLEMPPGVGAADDLVAAVERGELTEQVLTERARRVLQLVARGQHVLELDESFDVEAHHALAREAAGRSVVLLKNDGLLPLAGDTTVAVIGELARTARFQGAGSSQVVPTRVVSILDAVTAARGEVPFAPGYLIDGNVIDGGADAALVAEAAAVAGQAEVAVVVIGLPASAESEGFDRTHLNLPAAQLEMLAAVAAANPRVVVVLVNGSTVTLGEVAPQAGALVEAWLGGQAAGEGIVDVLTGVVNPSGRLAETIPHRLADVSSTLNFPGEAGVVRYGEGIYIGYRGYDKSETEVAFPFGYGLSYTEFAYSDLAVEVQGSVAEGTLSATVTATVTNVGDRDGAEVVQVYVGDPQASVTRPVRELKGFSRVELAAGASQQVSITLDQRAFSYWSPQQRDWVVEAGDFIIEVGHHSRDLPLRTSVPVAAPRLVVHLHQGSTLQEWMADPEGGQLLHQATVAQGKTPSLSAEVIEMIGNFPMSTLANFGMGFSAAELDALVEQWQALPHD